MPVARKQSPLTYWHLAGAVLAVVLPLGTLGWNAAQKSARNEIVIGELAKRASVLESRVSVLDSQRQQMQIGITEITSRLDISQEAKARIQQVVNTQVQPQPLVSYDDVVAAPQAESMTMRKVKEPAPKAEPKKP